MIDEILKKIGVRGIEDLSDDERTVFLRWQKVLAKPDPTTKDLAELISTEQVRIKSEMESWENSKEKDLYLKAYSRILTFLKTAINAPEDERRRLRAELEQRFK